ncbi:MAG: hypothetical protein M0Z68_05460 [Gammaproteobacteria bacterium]|nr:hypothetical protein [Gammaproteobacteria bacterium]
MSRTLSFKTQQINVVKESVGKILQKYARAKTDRSEPSVVRSHVMEQIDPVVVTPDDATVKYQAACEAFLAEVVKARGMPVTAIMGVENGEDDDGAITNHDSDNFDQLLPLIRARLDWAIQNYLDQAKPYHANRQAEFYMLLDDFLQNPPSLAKEIGPRISPIKREVGYFARWSDTFSVLKNFSFPGEVQFIFDSQDTIAVRWDYSALDEQMDDPPPSGHRLRNDIIYTVKDNWALRKGLMVPGPAGYIEDVDIPGRQLGCMCSLSWITNLRDLPDNMLTEPRQVGGSQVDERSDNVHKGVRKQSTDGFVARLFRKVFRDN